ncbi:MAG: ATP-dependent helicase [Candidatus Promineifilaceae bacterium]
MNGLYLSAMSIELTDQQQAVVQHNEGPALVFAVAGAGKTTAMVRRIERLVRESVFEPSRILATSFGKMNERDLRQLLGEYAHCHQVKASTLHALGFDIVRQAQNKRLIEAPKRDIQLTRLDQYILNLAIGEASKQNVHYRREIFGMDRQDFLDYVGSCKANLRYADLNSVQLPINAKKLAKQAKAPSDTLEWYLPLYQLYEQVRQFNGWIGFDDMLMKGWELLHQHEELLTMVQDRYDCILVDEFQDVNLVQSELLDLITEPHRNYMAIGDDDQTIYEWRGAAPSYILDFPKRYTAQRYIISDNFRCPAAPLVLANRVIEQNKQRQKKRLNLTKGFDGKVQLHTAPSISTMADSIVSQVKTLQQNKHPLNSMAVLVRLHAQTPPIEQKLIAAELPYWVSKPFYERAEIKVLIDYCRLAWLEDRIKAGKPLGEKQKELWIEAWGRVHNRPKRYLNREIRQSIPRAVMNGKLTLADALQQHADRIGKDYLRDKLEQFSDDIDWLANNLNESAYQTLKSLNFRMEYDQFLRDSTSSIQLGEGRAVSVNSFIEYAQDKGTLLEFMGHIRELAAQKVGRDKQAREEGIILSTIHQAKGLEWPIVIIPDCNQGVMPFTETFAAQNNFDSHIEEERRLFYVALTRTQSQLYLYTLRGAPQSQFLQEGNFEAMLTILDKLNKTLKSDLSDWQKMGALTARDCQFVIRYIAWFELERYVEFYWQDTERKNIVGHFARAVQKEGLGERFGIGSAELAFWQRITPDLPEKEFPGIKRILNHSNVVLKPPLIGQTTNKQMRRKSARRRK